MNAKPRNLVRMEQLVKTFQEVIDVPAKQVIQEKIARKVSIKTNKLLKKSFCFENRCICKHLLLAN